MLETNCVAASEPHGQFPLRWQPFGLLFQALTPPQDNEDYVATSCAPQFALCGGLTTTRAQHLQAAAAVLDGYSRATPELTVEAFKTFGVM